MTYYMRYGKRVLDVVVSLILIAGLMPVMLAIALIIKLSSPGPVLFIQSRIGKDGKFFRIYKFRTMHVDKRGEESVRQAEEMAEQLAEQDILLKIENDPRVTPIGKFLRLTSLDELPQLFNTLRGNMSLVGPRPLVPLMLTHHPKENRERSQVLPGITGYWQIYARHEASMVTQMIDYDKRYIAEASLTTDLKVLALTLPAMITTRGAK